MRVFTAHRHSTPFDSEEAGVYTTSPRSPPVPGPRLSARGNMNHNSNKGVMTLPLEKAVRDKFFHTPGKFVEFPEEDVEKSLAQRF